MNASRCASLYALTAIVGFWVASAKGTPPADNGNHGTAGEVVRCVSLPGTKAGGPLDLYVARTKAKLPSAVLLLFPDQGQDVKALLTSAAWQDFAEDNSLDLLAVTPSTRSTTAAKNPLPPAVAANQEALVLQAVDHECGDGLPLLLYSGPQQATLAQGLLAANVRRVAAWCLRAPAHLNGAEGAVAPPGLVVSYKENKELYDALTVDFTRARKKGTRLGWLALAGDKPAADGPPLLDAFVRKYLAAALAAKSGVEAWQNIDTKLTVSAMDGNTHPERSAYLPHFSLASAWANLHVPGKPEITQVAIQEREEDTFNKAQPKLHLYLRKPLSAEKADGKIEGVLAFCTWKKEKDSLVGRLQNKDDFLVRYAEEHRLALLTWDTAQAWSVTQSADQRSRQENFQDDLGFDQLANAWERGVHVLCHDAGLPENNFLLYGISRGAQWAHRLALRKPAHFLAVHIHINSSYDRPTTEAKNILWLQTTGEREAGYEAGLRFYARCRELGYPIIFKAGENLGHSDSAQINALGLRFFDYALGVKAKRDAVVASAKAARGKHASPSLYALSGLDDAPFYGDFINQDVYGVEEKEMVPAGQRVPLPTQALARAWGSIETSSLLAVSNPAVAAAKLPAAASTPKLATSQGDGASEQNSQPGAAKSPSKPEATATATDQGFAERYRLAVQHAVTELPALAQANSAPNEAFLGQYQRLKASNDALLSDPSWPEQVARLVKEQTAAHPDFAREFNASVERAVLLYPALAQADSPMNAAFLAEYQRLKAAGDVLLEDPTWPEQIAQRASAKLATP